MKCKSCGTELAEESKFCSNCGKKVKQEKKNGTKTRTKSKVPDIVNEPLEGSYVRTPDFWDKVLVWLRSKWECLDLFLRFALVGFVIAFALFVISICKKEVWAIAFSTVQLFGLIAAVLMYKDLIRVERRKMLISLLLLICSILISVPNVWSYSWKHQAKPDKEAQTQKIAESTENPVDSQNTAESNHGENVFGNIFSNTVETPRATAECLGVEHQTLVEEFAAAGFKTVSVEEVAELKRDEAEKEGTVKAVSIGGETVFYRGQEFDKKESVVIQYYTLLPVADTPFSAEECADKAFGPVRDEFVAAGFKNIELEIVTDLISTQAKAVDTIEFVSIGGKTDFAENQEFDEGEQVIIRYHTLRKCKVSIEVDFQENWIFNKYDVDFLVDNKRQGSLSHGTDKTFEVVIDAGNHTLTFASEESSSVKGEVAINVEGDMKLKYQISCYGSYVSVKSISSAVLECETSPHTWGTATCEIPQTCVVCGKEEGAALGHTWTEATCTEAKTCSVCQDVYGSPKGHRVGEWIVLTEPTCGTAGTKEGMCVVCQETVSQVIEETGKHSYGDWETIAEPTCTAVGKQRRTCSICDSENYLDIAKLSHEYVESTIKEATYYEVGTKGEKCSVCGAIGKTQSYYVYNKTTLEAILDEYRANEITAEDKYTEDMYIEFKAKIASIEPGGLLSRGSITFEVDNGTWFEDEAVCYIKTSEQLDYAKTLKAGDKVTIKGLLKSVWFDPDYISNISVDIIEIKKN